MPEEKRWCQSHCVIPQSSRSWYVRIHVSNIFLDITEFIVLWNLWDGNDVQFSQVLFELTYYEESKRAGKKSPRIRKSYNAAVGNLRRKDRGNLDSCFTRKKNFHADNVSMQRKILKMQTSCHHSNREGFKKMVEMVSSKHNLGEHHKSHPKGVTSNFFPFSR